MLIEDTLTLYNSRSGKQNFWRLKCDNFSAVKAIVNIFISLFSLFLSLSSSPSLNFLVHYNLLNEKILVHRLVIVAFFTSVTPHVCFQGTRAHKRKTTFLTLEWSLSCVASLMISKVSVCSKRNTANVTFVGFYPIVNSVVNFKITALGEELPTDFTLKRFDTLMRSYVNFQTTSSGVRFRTVRTLKGKFTCVYQLVCLLMSFSNELLSTASERTNKWSFSSLKWLNKIIPPMRL